MNHKIREDVFQGRFLTAVLPRLFFLLVFFCCSSGIGFTLGKSGINISPPFSIGKTIFETPCIYRLTDKHVVTKDSDGLSFLDVQTGKPVQAVDFKDDRYEQTFFSLSNGNLSAKTVTFSQNWNGDSFVSGENSNPVRLDGGLFYRYLKKDSNTMLFSVLDANSRNMLWEREIAVASIESQLWAQAFDDLLLVNIGDACYFFNLRTGVLKLTIQPIFILRSQRWGNFLLVGKYLISIDDMVIVREFDTGSLVLDAGRVCVYSHPEKKESGWYSFVDLATMEETFFKLVMPQGSYIEGVCNGLVMCWNAGNNSAQIIDPLTTKVYFSHQINQVHSQRWGFFENDRHILFFDAAQMSCFDTQSKKLLWEKQFATYLAPVGEDNLYSTPFDSDMVKYFDMNNPQKSLIIPVEKLNRPNVQLFSMPKCIIISQKVGNTIQITRYGFDGSEKELPVFMEVNGEIQYHCCLDAGGASYLISYANEQSRLYKLEGKTWKMVQDLEKGYFDFVSNDRFIVGQSRGRLFVFDTKTGKSKIVDDHPRYDKLIFIGNYSVGFQIQDGYTITDLTLGKILNWSIYGHYLGFEEGKFWTVEKKKITKIRFDGETEEFETIIPFKGNEDKAISIANGLILYKGILYSPDGRFCQQLTLEHGSNIWTRDQKLFMNYMSYGIERAQLQPCPAYTLKNMDGSIVITNTGKEKLTGYFCLDKINPDFPVVRLGLKHAFNVEPAKSIELAKLDSGSEQLLAINANGLLDMDKTDVAPKQRKYMSFEGSQLDYDGTAWTLTQLSDSK